MSEANLRGMQTFFNLGNAHDVEGVAGMVHPDYIGESDVLPEPIVGRDAYRSLLSVFWTAFPDTSYRIEQMLAADDCVITRLRLTGTHRGDFMGVPPTGKPVDTQIIDIMRFDDDFERR